MASLETAPKPITGTLVELGFCLLCIFWSHRVMGCRITLIKELWSKKNSTKLVSIIVHTTFLIFRTSWITTTQRNSANRLNVQTNSSLPNTGPKSWNVKEMIQMLDCLDCIPVRTGGWWNSRKRLHELDSFLCCSIEAPQSNIFEGQFSPLLQMVVIYYDETKP